MNTLRMEILADNLTQIAREGNVIKKGREALTIYKDFISESKKLIIEMGPSFKEFDEKIQAIVQNG
mgnify:FL=1